MSVAQRHGEVVGEVGPTQAVPHLGAHEQARSVLLHDLCPRREEPARWSPGFEPLFQHLAQRAWGGDDQKESQPPGRAASPTRPPSRQRPSPNTTPRHGTHPHEAQNRT